MRVTRTIALAVAGLLLGSFAVMAQPQERPRGFLGVRVDPEQAESKVIVGEVTPDSPAAKAGVKPGDVITRVNDKDVKNAESFVQVIAAQKPGDKITLQVTRDGKEEKLTATLGERPQPQREQFPAQPRVGGPERLQRGGAFLGVQMQELTGELKNRLKIETETGVVVTEVEPDSPAAKAGLKADDVITGIGDKPVVNPEQLRKTIQDTGAGKELTLRVTRGKEKMDVKATLTQGPRFRALQPGGFGRGNLEQILPFTEGNQKVQELEKKVQELEKRIQELEKKQK